MHADSSDTPTHPGTPKHAPSPLPWGRRFLVCTGLGFGVEVSHRPKRTYDADMSVAFPEIPDFEPSGDLPRGRFCVSMDTVSATLVKGSTFAGSSTRDEVWEHFEQVIQLIKRKRVNVPAVFLGGSFTTNAEDPSDVDVAILVDTSRITNPQTLAAVQKIAKNTKAVGLKVDAFIIPWHPDGSESGGNVDYARKRGFWDDFWQRKVAKADRIPALREHSMPVRGYLEVIVDGYV